MKNYADYISEINDAVQNNKPLSELEFISDIAALSIADETGIPVAFKLFQAGHVFTNPEILAIKTKPDMNEYMAAQYVERGYVKYHHTPKSLAEEMASKGYFFDDPTVQKMQNVAKHMVEHDYPFSEEQLISLNQSHVYAAQFMADKSKVFESKKILTLASLDGTTVAHVMAKKGFVFTDISILSLKDNSGKSVAHVTLESGHTFSDPEVLKIADKYGRTVAHSQAEKRIFTEDENILKLKDINQNSVAMIQALNGWTTQSRSILMLQDANGHSVAEVQAKNGYVFSDPEICSMTNHNGYPVGYYMALNGNFVPDPKTLATIVRVKTSDHPRSIYLSKDAGYNKFRQSSEYGSMNILEILLEKGKVPLDSPQITQNGRILSIIQTHSKEPLISSLYRSQGFVPSLDVAKEMTPNSLILFVLNTQGFTDPSKKAEQFKHLIHDKELMMTTNTKGYPIALAFSKVGIEFTDPDILKVVNPQQQAPVKQTPVSQPLVSNDNWKNNVFPRGKHPNCTFEEVLKSDPDYMQWCYREKRFNVHNILPISALEERIGKKEHSASSAWKDLTMTVGIHNGKSLGELCEKKMGYIAHLHGKGMRFIVDNVPIELVNEFNQTNQRAKAPTHESGGMSL